MDRRHASWQELGRAAGNPERFGHKAARLAQARSQFPVIAGWVLDVRDTARVDATSALAWADALLALDPAPRWILRSSSPLEDTAVSTAAGLFASVSAAAVPEALADALLEVIRSADDPRVRAQLAAEGADGPLPLAVLAQPHVEFLRWCTVEARTEGSLLEGWAMDHEGRAQSVRARLEAVPAAWAGLRTLAERVRESVAQLPVLMELGEDATGATWLLQVRRAPDAAPHWTRPGETVSAHAVPVIEGLGAHVHPGDADAQWVWDSEHCPTALCPLLAGLFGPWIAANPSVSSRLIHGRWHDRARIGASTRAEATELDLDTVDRELERWRRRERDELLPGLTRLATHVENAWTSEGAPEAWRAFTRDWLEWQRLYFDVPSGTLRRWARGVVARSGRGIAPPLGETVARARSRRWDSLATRLRAHPAAPPARAQALRDWARQRPTDPLARELAQEHERCAHLCGWAFDGRGVPWQFDPLPFWAAIAARMRRPDTSKDEDAEPRLDPLLARASAVFTRAEDDDDLLLMAYWHWHRAIRRAAGAAGEHAPDRVLDLLDLLPADLSAWLRDRDRALLDRALARGRSLARAWDARTPDPMGKATGPDEDRLPGVAAAPGRREGRVQRAQHLGSIESSDEVVAVVSTVSPSDAVYIAGLVGLVCEGGDLLGHASVLAREHGVPCVVGVADARRRCAYAERVLVDGDRGEVVVTTRRIPGGAR